MKKKPLVFKDMHRCITRIQRTCNAIGKKIDAIDTKGGGRNGPTGGRSRKWCNNIQYVIHEKGTVSIVIFC